MKLSELLAKYAHLDMEVEDIPEGEIIADAVLIMRTASMGKMYDAICIEATEGLGGVVQYGMIAAAKLQCDQWMLRGDEESE